MNRRKPLTSLELFAGAGGLALGVHDAGFKHLALIERDPFAVETLRENSQRVLNLKPEFVKHADAHLFDFTQYINKVVLLSGGPPCQPFSTAGRNLGHDDNRNLFPVFLDAVAIIRPKAILIENVKGLLRTKFDEYFRYLIKRIEFPLHRIKKNESWVEHFKRLQTLNEGAFLPDEQYEVTYQLVDAADFGIPQRRERVFITAFRRDLNIKTFDITRTHSKEALLIDQWVTGKYWERHNTRPENHLGPKDEALLSKLRNARLPFCYGRPWKTVRDALFGLPEPVPRGAKESFSNHVQHPGARTYPSHIGSFLDYPAKALKAGTHGTPGGENMLRMSANGEVRYFTTREAARLQTFPDKWHFHGTWGACIRQLGNAVPVALAKIFALEINQRLSKR